MEGRYERRWWKEGNDVRVDEGLRRDIRVAIHVYSEEGGKTFCDLSLHGVGVI